MASNDAQVKRAAVAAAYSSKAWVRKVNAMSETQIIAIYLRLKSQGKI